MSRRALRGAITRATIGLSSGAALTYLACAGHMSNTTDDGGADGGAGDSGHVLVVRPGCDGRLLPIRPSGTGTCQNGSVVYTSASFDLADCGLLEPDGGTSTCNDLCAEQNAPNRTGCTYPEASEAGLGPVAACRCGNTDS